MATTGKSFQYRADSWSYRSERIAFWLFRLATYLVLLAATWIFLDIGVKGAQTVFRASFPFINVPFLTEPPQTLHVFEDREINANLNDRKAQLAMGNLPTGEQRQLEAEIRILEKERKSSRLLYSDEEFRSRTDRPSEAIYEYATYSYSGGGIAPAIVGTLLLVIGSMTIALILGVLSAIYLSEYSRDGRFIRMIRLAIINLAGVPSIVFGIFGVGMFVHFFGWNVSLMAGWFTLAFMVLPIIITASEESLRSVPQGFREGALALGATKWESIRSNVLPYALPGILTSSVLGIARVAGETAPIMFTAAFAISDRYPWEVDKFSDFFFQGVMALPYHIYVVSAKIPQNEYTQAMQYGTAFVFLGLVLAIAMSSLLLRAYMRQRYRW